MNQQFKLAWKVLGRKKFFTGIALFGISFTLMILMLVTSFLDHQFGKHAPMSAKERMVFLPNIILKKIVTDTLWTYDSTETATGWTVDSSFTTKAGNRGWSQSSFNGHYLRRELTDFDLARNYSIFSPGESSSYTMYPDGAKLTFTAAHTDGRYWQLFDFDFTEGQPYTTTEAQNGNRLVVMTDEAAERYFGKRRGVLGETLELDGLGFEVIGVVADPQTDQVPVNADIWIPSMSSPITSRDDGSKFGTDVMVYLVDRPEQRRLLIDELAAYAARADLSDESYMNTLELIGMDWRGFFGQMIAADTDATPEENWRSIFLVMLGLLLLFLLLPTLNLININVSRILERRAEIGVRRAFGADRSSIMRQFIFENIVLTFVGGIIGIALALVAMSIINTADLLPDLHLRFNWSVLGYSLLLIFGFGLLSGLIPAYRVSRLKIADSLR